MKKLNLAAFFLIIFLILAAPFISGWDGKKKIWDGKYNSEVDQYGYVVDIAPPHHQTHKGRLFTRCYRSQDVAANGTLVMLFKTSDQITHGQYLVATGNKSFISLYEAPTISDNGTELSPTNMNRRSSYQTTVKVFHTPTVSDNGDFLCGMFIPAGKNSAGTGAALATRREWLTKANTDYLVVIRNEGTSAADLFIDFDWYEPLTQAEH